MRPNVEEINESWSHNYKHTIQCRVYCSGSIVTDVAAWLVLIISLYLLFVKVSQVHAHLKYNLSMTVIKADNFPFEWHCRIMVRYTMMAGICYLQSHWALIFWCDVDITFSGCGCVLCVCIGGGVRHTIPITFVRIENNLSLPICNVWSGSQALTASYTYFDLLRLTQKHASLHCELCKQLLNYCSRRECLTLLWIYASRIACDFIVMWFL